MSQDGKLFVGSLSYDTDEESLTTAFSKFGSIAQVDVVRDKDTGRSRGFGFVKFDNVEDASKAMEAMDGTRLDGRSIRVDEAGKGGSRSSGGFGGGRGASRFGGGRGGGGYDRNYGGQQRSYGGGSYD